MKLATVLVASALVTMVGACGGQSSDAPSGASAAAPRRLWLPAMTLELEVTQGADLRCLPALIAEVAVEGSELKGIVLADFLSGACDAVIGPSKRYYALETVGEDGCGQKVYRGWLGSAQGTSRLELRDRTGAACGIDGPGSFELVEHVPASAGVAALAKRYRGGW